MAGPRKVLIVDDSASMVRQLTKILADSGRYQVVASASDGMEAIKQAKAYAPELVCMDMIMPNMDGIQALRILKSLDAKLKVVMISSVGGVADKVSEALKAGATNVISKPFDSAKVLEVLDGV